MSLQSNITCCCQFLTSCHGQAAIIWNVIYRSRPGKFILFIAYRRMVQKTLTGALCPVSTLHPGPDAGRRRTVSPSVQNRRKIVCAAATERAMPLRDSAGWQSYSLTRGGFSNSVLFKMMCILRRKKSSRKHKGNRLSPDHSFWFFAV